MSLEEEIQKARTEIASDGYEMSVGEVVNLYRDKELIINPDFQRLFRWDLTRKTRFIESLLLGIPIPPIFVYQNNEGIWELIDGLQRLSTILEFMGILKDDDGKSKTPLILEGTRFLPSLAGSTWGSQELDGGNSIGQTQQLQIKRARLRIEILKKESDSKAKYELFQRLNTGGASLSEQEVRNCIATMINKSFYEWLKKCSENSQFISTINQTEAATEKQMSVELALRFFAFREIPYKHGLDVHEYLDEALMFLATSDSYNREKEKEIFLRTFSLLNDSMGDNSFKKWDGTNFKGQFLMSLFEVVAIGVSKNIDEISKSNNSNYFITEKCKSLWNNSIFRENSGAGVRGTTRLANLLPLAGSFFNPNEN